MRLSAHACGAILGLSLLCPGAAPAAEALTCEQLYAILQSTVRYRDQGYSLAQVLGAVKEIEAEGKLAPAELDVLRRSIAAAYLREVSPEEITLECVRAREAGRR